MSDLQSGPSTPSEFQTETLQELYSLLGSIKRHATRWKIESRELSAAEFQDLLRLASLEERAEDAD